jgi:hypothetical protein
MIPMIRESDGTVRPAKSALNAPPAPAPSRKPDDDFAAMFDGCMHLIVTIKGDFDEPVEPFMELHGSRLEAIDFEPGVVHFFQKSINGGKLVRGNYDLEAKLLNGAEVVATSRVHSIEVSRKASN